LPDYKLDIDINKLESIKPMQDRLLNATISYAAKKSRYYRTKFEELGICHQEITSIKEIEKLPITTKADIQQDNWSFLCVDRNNIAEVVATTGTTGKPVFFALTEGDLKRLAENEMRSFLKMGVGRNDLVHVAVTLDNLFIAGLAYYSGIRMLGAGVVRSGPYDPKRQLDLMRALGPTVIVAVPSFLLHIARESKKKGLRIDNLKLEKALLIGETIRDGHLSSNNLGRMVEDTWNIETFSTYGFTEASIAFTECGMHKGFHAHPDLIYAEIVDGNGDALPSGKTGELVVTTFKVEGMPLIRYGTGDITSIVDGECPCGEATQRIGPIVGRKAQKLKIKGTTVYPGAIEDALLDIEGVVNYQITAYAGRDGTDRITVTVGSGNNTPPFMEELRTSIKSVVRVTPEIEVLKPEEVEALLSKESKRKRMRFVDRRKTSKEVTQNNVF